MKLPAPAEAELENADTGIPYAASIPSAPLHVAESATVYRPRHPEQTSFYQLLETHFDEYAYAYEERFEPTSGPLRPIVRSTASS